MRTVYAIGYLLFHQQLFRLKVAYHDSQQHLPRHDDKLPFIEIVITPALLFRIPNGSEFDVPSRNDYVSSKAKEDEGVQEETEQC